MSPALVFRVEHATKTRDDKPLGPFRYNHENADGYSCRQLDAWNMPNPYGDGVQHYGSAHQLFGFLSVEDTHWFSPADRDVLRKVGYVMRSYMCPPGTFSAGKSQVAFDYREAIPGERIKLGSQRVTPQERPPQVLDDYDYAPAMEATATITMATITAETSQKQRGVSIDSTLSAKQLAATEDYLRTIFVSSLYNSTGYS